jgi:RNA polymerase sigma-70 factor, ECF subfamily
VKGELDASATSDEVLVQRIQEGDEEAFDVLSQKHWQHTKRRARFLLGGNEQDAEEVVVDVFLEVRQGLSSYAGSAQFGTWLEQITRNHCASWYRREYRRRELEARVHPLPPVSQDPTYDEVCLLLQIDQIGRAIAHLSEEQRTVIVQFYIEGHDYRYIAAASGMKIGTVRSHKHRANAKLRDIAHSVSWGTAQRPTMTSQRSRHDGRRPKRGQ